MTLKEFLLKIGVLERAANEYFFGDLLYYEIKITSIGEYGSSDIFDASKARVDKEQKFIFVEE